MLPGKLLLAVTLVIMALTAGCGKKKSGSDDEFVTETKPAATPEATEDIFDEFYKEDSAAEPERSSMQEPVVRSSAAPSFSENGRYVVQVSTLPSRSMADALAAKLDARGFPSYVAEVQNPTPSLTGTYYRVRIGGFDGVSAARSFGEGTLAADGYEYWVDYRSNDNVGLEGYGMGSGGNEYYSTPTSTATSAPATYDQSYTEPPPPPASAEPEPPVAPAEPPPEPATAAPETSAPAAPASQPEPSSNTSEWGNDDW